MRGAKFSNCCSNMWQTGVSCKRDCLSSCCSWHDTYNLSTYHCSTHNFPDDVDKSWYRGIPHIYLKTTATEPSSALRNAVEIENVLTSKFGSKENIPPIILLYTDGGPEHCITFLSVKIKMIAIQKSLNADSLIAVRTASGHSYWNPVEKIVSWL